MCVDRYLEAAASQASGELRNVIGDISVHSPPSPRHHRILPTSPMSWYGGVQETTIGLRVLPWKPVCLLACIKLLASARWEIITPLGSPVLPLVN